MRWPWTGRAEVRRQLAALRRHKVDVMNARRCDHPCASCHYLDRLVQVSANQWLHEDVAHFRTGHIERCHTPYRDSACRPASGRRSDH